MPDDADLTGPAGAEGELPPPRKAPAKRGPRKSRPPVELDPASAVVPDPPAGNGEPDAAPATKPVKAARARKSTARKATLAAPDEPSTSGRLGSDAGLSPAGHATGADEAAGRAPDQPQTAAGGPEAAEAPAAMTPAKRAPRKRVAKAVAVTEPDQGSLAAQLPTEAAPAAPAGPAAESVESVAGVLPNVRVSAPPVLFQPPAERRRTRTAGSARTGTAKAGGPAATAAAADATITDAAITDATITDAAITNATITNEAMLDAPRDVAEAAPTGRRRGGRTRKATARTLAPGIDDSEGRRASAVPVGDEALTELLLDAEPFDDSLAIENFEGDIALETGDDNDDGIAGNEPALDDAEDEDAADEEDSAEDESAEETVDDEAGDGGEPGTGRRRRRRGRRGRGPRAAEADDAATDPEAESGANTDDSEDNDDTEDSAEDEDDNGDAALSPSARRRRRRRRSTSVADVELGEDDPPNTVVHVRDQKVGASRGGAADADGVRGVKGSTRLEAKRQRRRDSRDSGRRRAPIVTEAEFLARRESVERVMAVRQTADRTQIAVLEDGILVEHYVTRESAASAVGNVYLGRVQNVLPSMEAAFVDIGRGRNGVLYAGEVNWDAAGLEGKSRAIENAMNSGDPVLVQVTKDPIGHKGARLTSQISLPGRFVVYVPGGGMTGISRKLPDTERSRLKAILKKAVPDEAGVIVRTAAEGASEADLISDVERLKAQWELIQTRTASPSNAPSLVYGEPDLAIRVVRDVFNDDFSQLIVAGSQMYGTLTDYISGIAPDLEAKLHLHTAESDLFADLRVDEQLAKALDRKVWLPSGGSLVIDRTEAMTVVDVNTGKYTGSGGNLESTVTRNNLEAAEEVVRQLRLRDIGGIIVIDFIDMVLESNRELVLRRLTECLGRDRTKHQVAEVTSLGLVQMTRKRVGEGLLEAFSEPCEHCKGRGVILHAEPIAVPIEDSSDGEEERSGRPRRGRRGSKPAPGGQDREVEAVLQSQRRSAATAIAAIAAATAAKDSVGYPEAAEDEPAAPEAGTAGYQEPVTRDSDTETAFDAEADPESATHEATVGVEETSRLGETAAPEQLSRDEPAPAWSPPLDLAPPRDSQPAAEPRALGSRPRRRRAASRPAGPPAPVTVG